MHRNTGDTESIIVEYGFLDSNGDDVSQIKNNWQNYAEAVVQAILKYIGYTGMDIDETAPETVYIVQSGDTLYELSKRFGLTVDEIKRLNNLTSDLLSIGQTLYLIPNATSMEDTYIVKAGDSLYSIAKKYGLSVDELKRLNGLTSNILSIGQVLLVGIGDNESSTNTGTYMVKAGDTLYSIAKKYGLTVAALKEMNGLTNNLLSIGQTLIVS